MFTHSSNAIAAVAHTTAQWRGHLVMLLLLLLLHTYLQVTACNWLLMRQVGVARVLLEPALGLR
jgi:diacylglycerol kinase